MFLIPSDWVFALVCHELKQLESFLVVLPSVSILLLFKQRFNFLRAQKQ